MHLLRTAVQPIKHVGNNKQYAQNHGDPHIAELDALLGGGNLGAGGTVVAVTAQVQANDPAGKAHAGLDEHALEGGDRAGDAAVLFPLGVVDGVRLHGEHSAEDAQACDHQTGQLAGDGGGLLRKLAFVGCILDINKI